jgi:hypothetical protein
VVTWIRFDNAGHSFAPMRPVGLDWFEWASSVELLISPLQLVNYFT